MMFAFGSASDWTSWAASLTLEEAELLGADIQEHAGRALIDSSISGEVIAAWRRRSPGFRPGRLRTPIRGRAGVTHDRADVSEVEVDQAGIVIGSVMP